MGKKLTIHKKIDIVDKAFTYNMNYRKAIVDIMGDISDAEIYRIIKNIDKCYHTQLYTRIKFVKIQEQYLQKIIVPKK